MAAIAANISRHFENSHIYSNVLEGEYAINPQRWKHGGGGVAVIMQKNTNFYKIICCYYDLIFDKVYKMLKIEQKILKD